jgi:hypothetical protein
MRSLLQPITKELKVNHRFWIGTLTLALLELLTLTLPLGQYTFKAQGIFLILYLFLAPGPTKNPKPACSVCGSPEGIESCNYCRKPLCGLHRIGTGELAQGYTCKGSWVECRRPKTLLWVTTFLVLVGLLIAYFHFKKVS